MFSPDNFILLIVAIVLYIKYILYNTYILCTIPALFYNILYEMHSSSDIILWVTIFVSIIILVFHVATVDIFSCST